MGAVPGTGLGDEAGGDEVADVEDGLEGVAHERQRLAEHVQVVRAFEPVGQRSEAVEEGLGGEVLEPVEVQEGTDVAREGVGLVHVHPTDGQGLAAGEEGGGDREAGVGGSDEGGGDEGGECRGGEFRPGDFAVHVRVVDRHRGVAVQVQRTVGRRHVHEPEAHVEVQVRDVDICRGGQTGGVDVEGLVGRQAQVVLARTGRGLDETAQTKGEVEGEVGGDAQGRRSGRRNGEIESVIGRPEADGNSSHGPGRLEDQVEPILVPAHQAAGHAGVRDCDGETADRGVQITQGPEQFIGRGSGVAGEVSGDGITQVGEENSTHIEHLPDIPANYGEIGR